MTELVFQIEEDSDGGYTAKAVGASIFTEADTLEQLRDNIRDAVTCHFEKPEDRPKIIRLHFTRDEVIAL
jgi:predicted RNase H-like HicB family nuclease